MNFALLCFASKQKLLNRSEAKFQNRSRKKSQSRVPLKKSNRNCRRLHSCLKGPKREIFVAGIARKWPLPAYLYSLVCVFKSSTQRSPLILNRQYRYSIVRHLRPVRSSRFFTVQLANALFDGFAQPLWRTIKTRLDRSKLINWTNFLC